MAVVPVGAAIAVVEVGAAIAVVAVGAAIAVVAVATTPLVAVAGATGVWVASPPHAASSMGAAINNGTMPMSFRTKRLFEFAIILSS
jgi:hypothetical protein